MNKKSILIIVAIGIIVIIGIIFLDLYIPREKRLDGVDYSYSSQPIKAYSIKEDGDDIILTQYLEDPFRRVILNQFSNDVLLEGSIVTDYFENKFSAILNYIFNYKEKYKDNDVKLKGNAIIYTDNSPVSSDYTKQRFYDEYINFFKDIPKVN